MQEIHIVFRELTLLEEKEMEKLMEDLLPTNIKNG
jgi:hypothetical protein